MTSNKLQEWFLKKKQVCINDVLTNLIDGKICQRSPMITWPLNCFCDNPILLKSYRINSRQHLWQFRTEIFISNSLCGKIVDVFSQGHLCPYKDERVNYWLKKSYGYENFHTSTLFQDGSKYEELWWCHHFLMKSSDILNSGKFL